MAIRKTAFAIKGMTRDMAVSKFSPELAYENQNIRMVATDDNTSYGLVNEKGTLPARIVGVGNNNFIQGTPIGQEVINDTLVLFTTENEGSRTVTINGVEGGIDLPNTVQQDFESENLAGDDHIYKFKIQYDNEGPYLQGSDIFSGNLGFDPGCPIECIGVYENDSLQKVYWTDGIHQPRVINITGSQSINGWNNNSFNFVQRAQLNGSPEITRNDVSFGSFAPGTIQYCFTYYNLYGPETNIVYTSPLFYISHADRGAKEDETVSCSFNIKIQDAHIDDSFDYLRIYSIQRTSINATPIVRKVVDITVRGINHPSNNNDVYYTDAGNYGEIIDPMELFYKGGDPIVVGTMAQKDNTLFMGDITLGREPIPSEVRVSARSLSVTEADKLIRVPEKNLSTQYSYTSQLSKSNSAIAYFKNGETYRLGFQAQHYTGRWSDVVFIKDHTVNHPITDGSGGVNVANLSATINGGTNSIIDRLVKKGYIRVRPVVVFPDGGNRTIICQGVLCPTVYNVEDRFSNAPFAQSSWYWRPSTTSDVSNMSNATSTAIYGKWAEFRHNHPIPSNTAENSEIQCIVSPPQRPYLNYGRRSAAGQSSSTPIIWAAKHRECFYIDQSILTLHTPDIEFGEELVGFSGADHLHLKIVGYVPLNASYSDIDIEATPPMNYSSGYLTAAGSTERYGTYPYSAPGFVKTTIATTSSAHAWKCMLSGPMWFDELSNTKQPNTSLSPVGFIVYPWHRNGSLNNSRQSSTEGELPSRLLHKKMSVMRYSNNSVYLSNANSATYSISGAAEFNSDQVTMIKLPSQGSGSPDISYYGNVDKLVAFHAENDGRLVNGMDLDVYMTLNGSSISASAVPSAYPIVVVNPGTGTRSYLEFPSDPVYSGVTGDKAQEDINVRIKGDYRSVFCNSYVTMAGLTTSSSALDPNEPLVIGSGSGSGGSTSTSEYKRYVFYDSPTCANEPVSMKYKSSPHIVVALSKNSGTQVVLPRAGSANDASETPGANTFWGASGSVSQSSISASPSDGYLWLAELYRDDIGNARFGGTTEEAIEANTWLPAGEPVSLVGGVDSTSQVGSVTLIWDQGDTYYQRYDCLKTYPFTLEDQNSITDVLSFRCETRVNIDGRSDKNRGKLSNLYTTPTNYNLFNPVYSQTNNFFTYRSNNAHKINTSTYPNTITWSKTKTAGEAVDSWTNTSLASTLDLDGDKGRIRALRRFDNNIIAFQDRGISQVLYNENMQVAPAVGVPIEIANSGKVSGKRYISNHIGCVNKWSICSAPTGLYFMDDIGKDIYLFNGQLNNISDKYGFHSWVITNFPDIKVWNPRDFDTSGEITYYDKINGDVLFITGNTTLAFSEPLNSFSSFYSYEKTPYFSILRDKGVMWHKDDSLEVNDTNADNYRAWWYREGDYNKYFEVYHPFSVTVIANEHPTEDKIFNNLEYRGDTFKYGNGFPTDEVPEVEVEPLADGTYMHENTFDRLETWNEYQRGIADPLIDVKDQGSPVSNLKKKFRIWRANIPRNTENVGGDENVSYIRDRMRNPWLYIKLSKEEPNTNKTVLHDLVVYYYE